MSETSGTPADANLIARFFAKRVVNSAKKGAVNEVELAERISEIELETQILGASFIKVKVIDPDWSLQTSGWLEVKEGFLDEINVEFPEGSKWMWTLCAVEGTRDPSGFLELTFESHTVVKLREKWGPKQAPAGTRTRAQFVRDLLHEANVPYVIPGLNVVQRIEEEEKGEFGTEVVRTSIEKQKTEEKANKTKGVGHGAEITIEGAKPTQQQLADINTALAVAHQKNAPPAAVEALIVAGITESGFRREASENNDPNNPHKGIWQSDKIPPQEVARQAEHFLIGGESFAEGGAIERARKGIKPAKIAVEVEVGGSEARNEAALPEAKAIIAAGGGVIGEGGEAGGTTESDVGQLTRGTPGNPDEDSFECVNRLASQVNWFAFTSAIRGQQERMFYITGPELARQTPAAYIDVPNNHVINSHTRASEYGNILQNTTYTFDNTTFEYRRDHKVKARVQRRSKVAKPSTPSEIRLEMICNPTDYRAGDVFVFQHSGPINGRWIVTDATRNVLKDTFTKFILEPPVEPLPEPVATAKGAELTGEASQSVAAEAKKALAEQKATKPYRYVYGGGHQAGSKLFGAAPREMDCSAFASLCYKEAGLPVPGQSGSTLPATNAMIAAMKKTSNPQPGALVFYGSSTTSTDHVAVFVGGQNVISMGTEGDPSEYPAANGPAGLLGYWEP